MGRMESSPKRQENSIQNPQLCVTATDRPSCVYSHRFKSIIHMYITFVSALVWRVTVKFECVPSPRPFHSQHVAWRYLPVSYH